MSATDLHRTIEAVWRIESARVIGGLIRLTRDVGLAEDLTQEALVAALEQWPQFLTGASAGGLFARIFAREFRDDVAGMVLVDTVMGLPISSRSTVV